MGCNIGVCGEMFKFAEKNRRFEWFVVRIQGSEFGVGVKRLGSKSCSFVMHAKQLHAPCARTKILVVAVPRNRGDLGLS